MTPIKAEIQQGKHGWMIKVATIIPKHKWRLWLDLALSVGGYYMRKTGSNPAGSMSVPSERDAHLVAAFIDTTWRVKLDSKAEAYLAAYEAYHTKRKETEDD